MRHADHVGLLAPGIRADEGGTWADLGAGAGAFTLALADLIGPHGLIHAIDRDRGALAELRASAHSSIHGLSPRTTASTSAAERWPGVKTVMLFESGNRVMYVTLPKR